MIKLLFTILVGLNVYANELTIENQVLAAMCLKDSDCESGYECRRMNRASYNICVESKKQPEPDCPSDNGDPFPRGWW